MTASPQIHLYRPQRTDPEHLEAILVAREPLLKEMLDRLGGWHPGASRQHYMIIGPRGIGKTCLLQVLQHRISHGRLDRMWLPAMLPEEGYKIRSVAALLIEALQVCAEQANDDELQQAHERVRRDLDDKKVVDLALDAFRSFHRRDGRGIVLMMENAGRVLDLQMRHGAQTHLLRKILVEEDWLVMLATSPTYVNAVTEHQEALFEFFQVKLLGELTVEEQTAMLRKLAALEQNTGFEEYLEKFGSRLRALYHFTGGNPRLAVMLYDLVAHQCLTDVQAELDALLDKLTPFYQDRMRDLEGTQEAQLLEQMALLPEGCTPTELAREARMPAKNVRALMTRLEKSGYVRREQRRSKRTIYIIPERFFRIWHQMTHSQEARGRVQYLLEFFSTWYAGREERDHAWEELTESFREGLEEEDEDRLEDLAQYMQYVAAVSEGEEKYEREFETLRLMARRKGRNAVDAHLAQLDVEYREDPRYFLQKGRFLAHVLRRQDRAHRALERALQLGAHDPIVLYACAECFDSTGYRGGTTSLYKQAAVRLAGHGSNNYSEKMEGALLQLLRKSSDDQILWVAASLLGRIGASSNDREILAIATATKKIRRKQCCAHALGLIRGNTALNGLLSLARDNAKEVRAAVALALGQIRSEAGLELLIEALRDKDDIVRRNVAKALGWLGSRKAVEPLIDALRDKDAFVRCSAATALGKLASQKGVEPLIDALRDKDDVVRCTAATALGKLASQEAIEPLIGALRDKAGNVRGSAATALGRLGSQRAVEPLIDVLRDNADNVRGSAATALGELNTQDAVEPLTKALGDNADNVRGSAATALGRLGSQRAVEPLIEALRDNADNVRGSAATALGRLGSQRAAEPLIEALRDKAGNVRGSAATALGRLGSQRAVEPLIDALRDNAHNVRGSTAAALGVLDAQSAVEPLIKTLADKADDVRSSAAGALMQVAARHPLPQAPQALDAVLTHSPYTERRLGGVVRELLRSAFSWGDIDLIRQSVNIAVSRIEGGADIFSPYVVALRYIDSGGHAAFLERQYPEMREAAQLLIDLYLRSSENSGTDNEMASVRKKEDSRIFASPLVSVVGPVGFEPTTK